MTQGPYCHSSTIGTHACTNYRPENRCADCPLVTATGGNPKVRDELVNPTLGPTKAQKCPLNHHDYQPLRGGKREKCTKCGDVFPCGRSCGHFDCRLERGEELPDWVTVREVRDLTNATNEPDSALVGVVEVEVSPPKDTDAEQPH